MNFDKDKKTSPFSLNSSTNSNSPFSLQTAGQPLNQEKKSPFSLNSMAKPNLSSLNSNESNSNSNSPFSLSNSNINSNLFTLENKSTTTSSPFSLQTTNTKPLLNQLNSTNEKPSLFSLQSNVSKPILSNNNNSPPSVTSSSPFGLKSTSDKNSLSSPFSLSTNADKKLISPFSLSNSNNNSTSPFSLTNPNTNNSTSPFSLSNSNANNSSSPFTLQSNKPQNSFSFGLQNQNNNNNNSNDSSTVFPQNSLNILNNNTSTPFSLQKNSKPLSSMINDSQPTIFTLNQTHNESSNNKLSSVQNNMKPSNDNKDDIKNKKKLSPFSSKNNNENDLVKSNNIFASFNISNSGKGGTNNNHQHEDSLIAKPSGFAKFLLDIDEKENNENESSQVTFSLSQHNSKSDAIPVALKSPISPNILEDIDEDSVSKEALNKLNEIHKLFRNTSPYYLLNFIDWEETEGYDEEEEGFIESNQDDNDNDNDNDNNDNDENENENENKINNKDNEGNEKETKNSEKTKIHKLFRFDTPSPDDIVIMSREKGKKDMRDTNYRSTSYIEKKTEEENTQAINKMNTSNVEVSSDHVIRIGTTSPSTSKNSLLNSSSKGSSTISLSLGGDSNQNEQDEQQPIHPNGFNFNYRHDLLANAFKSEDEIFETEDEKAESDYYKYQKFEDENARILYTEYPDIPDPLPAKYNSAYYHKLDLEKEFHKRQETHYRKSLHITCLGPIKSGKSTLLGRIFEEYILKPENATREVKKIEKELQRRNLSLERKYAWLMDETKIERERNTTLGITTDFSIRYNDRELVIYDTPGHTDYIATTISELYQTDVILLLIDASSQNINNECDIAIIKDYLFLCKCIGIQDILIIINKMEKVKYSEIIFDKLISKMKKIVEDQFKFKESHVKYIPVDGLNGENLFEKSKNPLLSWYKDDYLFSYLDKIEMVKKEEEKEELIKKMIHEPFKMVVKDYMREGGISGSSVTVEGRICSGSIQVGNNLFTIPNYDVPFIRAIECQGQLVKFATTGDYVKIGLGNIDISKISKDTILSSIEQPIKLVNKFKAQILVNSSNTPIIKGTNAIMYINNNQESVYIKKIKMKKIKNPENNKIHYKRTTIIPKNTTAEVIIQLHDRRRLPLETYMKHRPFGRFILQHDSEIIASGVVLELL